jgi:hypothetical protein
VLQQRTRYCGLFAATVSLLMQHSCSCVVIAAAASMLLQ